QVGEDVTCTKGSIKYYIQSAYILETKEKIAQEIRPFIKIK
ncbi:MAG TPA: ATPase, partial [Erysipelotrichaceae bacterium]|nr:ATPase [Erysipelotrichaceae bacterium]